RSNTRLEDAGRLATWAGGFSGALGGNLLASELLPAYGSAWPRIGIILTAALIFGLLGYLARRSGDRRAAASNDKNDLAWRGRLMALLRTRIAGQLNALAFG